MKVEECKAYEVVDARRLEDLNSFGYLLRHKKTGARVALISNDDENKVFNIAFRTPPENSTGVAHIIEHTVLCGSKKYPAKDPFMELEKSSLNTFLNAMTYPDKTMYPVASCNDKDFQNLMDVYLDAVFHPNIYNEKKIFMQEGWHYECNAPEEEITINGVVYNEMKGAFSSADDVLYREIMNSLYPNVTYGKESGGDPLVIPELSYEEYLDFHRKYYHPSNSYIYLYGNMDMAEKLVYLDENYLSQYEKQEIDSEIPLEKSFSECRYVNKTYSISEGESEKDNTYLAYNFSIGTSLDRNLYVALQVLDYVLCSAQGAPIKEALIHKGIGTEVFGYCENGIRQPYFSFIAKNANEEQKQEFIETIEDCLRDLVENGLDEKALLAGINNFEFRYREADFGNYPKGLMYGLQMFDSWLYDDNAPFIHIEANDTYAFLKENVKTGYFENLVRTGFIENLHRCLLVLSPEKGKVAKEEEALSKKLQSYKESLSEKELLDLIEETKALREYQEEEDSEEILALIPTLSLEDIKKEAEPLSNDLFDLCGQRFLHHNVFTNGIAYLRMIFDLSQLPEKYFPYLGIFRSMIGSVNTEKHTYAELDYEEHIISGGIAFSYSSYTNAKDSKDYMVAMEVRTKTLFSNLQVTLDLIHEMIFTSCFEDKDRLHEILEELRSKIEGDLIGNGHVTAVNRAESYYSEPAKIGEIISGVPAYHQLVTILENFEQKAPEVIQMMKELVQHIFRKENLMVDLTANEEGLAEVRKQLPAFIDRLAVEPVEKGKFVPTLEKENEAFACASQVQYVCRAGNFANHGVSYHGSLRVAKSILSRDYLWNNVRVKNGAYGCMCAFRRNGDCYFVSYRDPKLMETVAIFEEAADYMEHFEATREEVTKYIIGTISDMDIPLTPSTRGARSLNAYMSKVSFEEIQKERDEVLATTVADIRESANAIRAFMSDDCFSVVGNENKIKTEKEHFHVVKQLILG